MGSKFSNIEQYRVSIFGPKLRLGIWENWFEPKKPFIFLKLFSSLVHPTVSESCRACQKAHGLGQDLGLGSFGYLAYFLRAFLLAWAF